MTRQYVDRNFPTELLPPPPSKTAPPSAAMSGAVFDAIKEDPRHSNRAQIASRGSSAPAQQTRGGLSHA
jgi:hypothetical protein